MNCPVCNRNNAVTLSICPSCGAMINDTVRKELVPKISNHVKSLGFELKEKKTMSNKTAQSPDITAEQSASAPTKPVTSEITMKTTSPTLIEFHSKNTAIPEWRLQLQNVVRQRQERETTETAAEVSPPTRAKFVTSGATALKPDAIQETKTVQHKNPTLSSALNRIENSRRQFLTEEKPQSAPIAAAPPTKANKNYPFYIAGKTSDANFNAAEINPPINSFAKPKLASTSQNESVKLDTNKLPPLPASAQTATSFESQPVKNDDVKSPGEDTIQTKIELKETVVAKVETTKTVEITQTEEVQEFDDCAPFAMRFNAGLFDLIIGSFASLLLLSPFMLFGGDWLSVAGVFAFLATCAIVMFVYLTTAIGIYGRTYGMRLFSLEIVDIETEDYPTFHQAAVSSAVYLLTLALGGIGFLTLPFNEDKRAVHDLVSGTIIIREE